MFNTYRTWSTKRMDRPVGAGVTVTTEGLCCVAVLEAGVQKVALSAAGAGEIFLGFAIMDNQSIATDARVEDVTIPAVPGPYQVALSTTTPHGVAPNIEGRVYDLTAAAEITTQVATPAAVVGAANYCLLAGVLTVFNTRAGHDVRVFWRVDLTVAESQMLYGERSVNNNASAVDRNICLLTGLGEMWTYEYDMTVDWSGAVVPTTGAAGQVVNGGAGYALGSVIHVPDTEDSALGVLFNVRGGP